MSLRLRILAAGRSSSSDQGPLEGDPGASIDRGPERDEVRDWGQEAPRELQLGRHPDNDLELPYAGVSATHARLFQKLGAPAWWLEDLGSSNGTWVEETRLRPGAPRLLNTGDQFRLGALVLRVEAAAPNATVAESTATMGRRLIVGGLGPPPPYADPPAITTSPRPLERVRPAAAAAADPARRATLRGGGVRKMVLVGFAVGMTALAVSGLIALALSLR